MERCSARSSRFCSPRFSAPARSRPAPNLRAAAADYRFLPVALNGQEPNGTSEHKLSPGDRLTAVAELPALERLLRREPVPGGPDGSAATG